MWSFNVIFHLLTIISIVNGDCTYNGSDTCIIDRGVDTDFNGTMENNITCDSTYSSCIIICDDEMDGICSDSYLQCPKNDNCDECIINCNSRLSCQNAVILSYRCRYVEINIAEFSAGQHIKIHAPGNNGSLTINAMNNNSHFASSVIYSNSETNNIEIHCDENGNKCENNTIFAQEIHGNFHLYCTGDNVNCDHTKIHCPSSNDSLCDIECSMCSNSNIYSFNVDKLDWRCAQDEYSCVDSKLFCGMNESILSQHPLIYENESKQWLYENQADPCKKASNSIKMQSTSIIRQNGTITNTNDYNTNSKELTVTYRELIYFGAVLACLVGCCCVMVGLFFIYNYMEFKRKQKQLDYFNMTAQSILSQSSVEPVMDSPKLRQTSVSKLKPPTVSTVSSASTLPLQQQIQPPAVPLKFLNIDSGSEFIDSDHEISTIDDHHTDIEINSAASTDPKPESNTAESVQTESVNMNIEMTKMQMSPIVERRRKETNGNGSGEESDAESDDEDMYQKVTIPTNNGDTKGNITTEITVYTSNGDAMTNGQTKGNHATYKTSSI